MDVHLGSEPGHKVEKTNERHRVRQVEQENLVSNEGCSHFFPGTPVKVLSTSRQVNSGTFLMGFLTLLGGPSSLLGWAMFTFLNDAIFSTTRCFPILNDAIKKKN